MRQGSVVRRTSQWLLRSPRIAVSSSFSLPRPLSTDSNDTIVCPAAPRPRSPSAHRLKARRRIILSTEHWHAQLQH
jgi:hypothetical protein